MTPAQLTRWGERIFGPEWKSPLARALGIRVRYIHRYLDETRPMPAWLTDDRMLQIAAKEAARVEKMLERLEAIAEGD